MRIIGCPIDWVLNGDINSISIEFILTGVNINFITFATYCDNVKFDGYILALFYLAIGAVELAVALYIFYLMYNKKQMENIDKYGDL